MTTKWRQALERHWRRTGQMPEEPVLPEDTRQDVATRPAPPRGVVGLVIHNLGEPGGWVARHLARRAAPPGWGGRPAQLSDPTIDFAWHDHEVETNPGYRKFCENNGIPFGVTAITDHWPVALLAERLRIDGLSQERIAEALFTNDNQRMNLQTARRKVAGLKGWYRLVRKIHGVG